MRCPIVISGASPDFGDKVDLRLAHQQVHVLRHDHLADDTEIVLPARPSLRVLGRSCSGCRRLYPEVMKYRSRHVDTTLVLSIPP